ncbi:TonB-dependent receptor plug domain-containing protein [Alteraurantiacibacter aestuarii]|uniref:TonB-dependent receptor plug domain-containing protein n=1 Tax=Alteraurantiacibacter aestuarii TaxID=650004 RepID=A0A844ZMV4_9SPHN|nr:TonB-dependent receptor [Alteraurantiacibacter aestuarii]MXO88864.1 TonB-dependent receptor plug domain-containing protein [Alteraurantiacibacter aestuarii]
MRDAGRFALAAALLCAANPAWAQEEDTAIPGELLAGPSEQPVAAEQNFPLSNAPRVYVPEDFARFAPRTALNLIEQIPGFNVEGGGGGFNGGGRGFGEASGNLLINGDRISSKSTSTRDELSRIPVSNVVRIEIVDGASLEIPGLSGQVANVIVRTGSMSGQFSWRPQISTGPAPVGWSEGNISVRGSASGVNYSLAFNSGGFIRGSEGPSIFTDSAGVVDERFNTQSADFKRPSLTGSFAFEIAPEVKVNLNLSGGLTIFRSDEEERRTALNPLPTFFERFRSTNDQHSYEIGGDIEFPLGPGKLKLIALESYEHGNFKTSSLLDLGTAPTSGSRYERLSDTGERIARAEYSWGMLNGDWQISGEAAFNRLDNVASLFGYNAITDEFFQIPFPAGTGGVREERFESILSYSTSLTEGLSLQLAAGGEYSKISQTGVNALSRTFQRPKGTVSLSWAAADGLDISLKVARRVGQLNFGDFLASVNLTDENQSTGNNQLRPQQSWETELEVSRNFGRWGSATLTLFDHRIEDFLTIIPTIGGGESSGNIDSAHRRGLRLNGTLQMEALGWRGAQLDVRISAEDSNLLDPVTFLPRRFDRNSPFEIRLDFRHDVPDTDWAWGVEFRDTSSALGYRLREVTLDYNVATFGAIFVENKDVLGLTIRGRVGNIFNGRNVLQRTIYSGPRNTAPVLFSEDRRLAIGQVFNLSVSGSF